MSCIHGCKRFAELRGTETAWVGFQYNSRDLTRGRRRVRTGVRRPRLATLTGLFDGPTPPEGRYVPPEAIDQADRGRTVTLPRPYGPDFELTVAHDREGCPHGRDRTHPDRRARLVTVEAPGQQGQVYAEAVDEVKLTFEPDDGGEP